MNREETIIEFLKGLRIVLSNASAYSKDHPYFVKSVESFKGKLDALFLILNPVKVNFTTSALFMDDKYWQGSLLYEELATLFHRRKIKGIELVQGASLEELVDFSASVSKPIKEILRQGGFDSLLDKVTHPHIIIESLDYSQLLGIEGEEAKDVWVYLFGHAVSNDEREKINEFADNFEQIIAKFKAKDLSEDEALRENIYNFFAYLQNKDKDRFYNCTKTLLKFVLKDKTITEDEKLKKLKAFFSTLTNNDLSQVLWEEIIHDDNFNSLSLAVFSQIFSLDSQKEVANVLSERIKESPSLKNNLSVRKKVKELFATNENIFIPEFYRHALQSLFESGDMDRVVSFDRKALKENYNFLLLNMLYAQKNEDKLRLIVSSLAKSIMNMRTDNEFMRFLLDALERKKKNEPSLEGALSQIEESANRLIEASIFESQDGTDLGEVFTRLKKSYLGINFYLENIFDQGKVNPAILALLLRFYPENLDFISDNLEKKHDDIEFLCKVAKALKDVASPLGMELLKRIFLFSNNIVKAEVLNVMSGKDVIDSQFLFSVLDKEELNLKKQAFLILSRDEKLKMNALEKLLLIPSPFGTKNKILMDNITVVEESGLKEAGAHLLTLSKKPFFWNSALRNKAREALSRVNV